MTTSRFLAGLLCLDLVNTEPMVAGARRDLLPGYAELIGWLGDAGVLAPPAARRALARWESTRAGEAVWREAMALRSVLRAGAERLAGGKPVGPGLVRAVNRILAADPSVLRVAREGGRYRARRDPLGQSPLRLLAPVAASAAWLLERGDPGLVRRCGGERCVLFFYDATKNHTRRWCSMDGCGGRAKANAYYRRTRSTAPAG